MDASRHHHPHGLALIGGGAIIDASGIAAGDARIDHGGVGGGHGVIVTVGQCPNTWGSDTNPWRDAHATGSRADAGDSHSTHTADSGRSGYSGGARSDATNARTGSWTRSDAARAEAPGKRAARGQAESDSKGKGRQVCGPGF